MKIKYEEESCCTSLRLILSNVNPMTKWLIILLSIVCLLAILLLILIFVIFPITFMLSITLQRFMVFLNIDQPRAPKYDDPTYYGIQGVQNLYIHIKDNSEINQTISLGAWFINHHKDIASPAGVENILRNTNYPVLLYLHGIACNRILPYERKYEIFRKFFHILAIDYRGYGDSSDVTLSEDVVVYDTIQSYNWLKNRTNSDVYIWGHSLGGGIAIKAVKSLEDISNPNGLVIESSFTNLMEAIYTHPLAKIFVWLPYFTSTIPKPLQENGFIFNSSSHIRNVDCPIMILHAEDDTMLPLFLGEQLYYSARDSRRSNQGLVTLHTISGLGYGHVGVTNHPNMSVHISEFMDVCEEFKMKSVI